MTSQNPASDDPFPIGTGVEVDPGAIGGAWLGTVVGGQSPRDPAHGYRDVLSFREVPGTAGPVVRNVSQGRMRVVRPAERVTPQEADALLDAAARHWLGVPREVYVAWETGRGLATGEHGCPFVDRILREFSHGR